MTVFNNTAQNLQQVTDNGSTTTNTITAQGFIGDGSQLTNITNFSRTTHGVVNLPAITNNGDGTVTIASTADINIMSTADGKTGNLLRFTDVTGGLINTLTDGNINYIYIDYNGGNPIYKVTTSPAIFINTFNLVPVFRISREGTSLYILDYDEFGIGLADKAFYKDVALHSVERQTGIILSTTATRISTVTGGVVWFGVTYKTLPTNTAGSSGTLYEYYLTGSVWSRSLVTSYDSTYYSDGTNRQTLGNNKYVAKYFYRDTSDNEVYYIHGGEHNTASEAFNEATPTAPITMTAHSFYVGKIVIQKNATNGTAYPRAWDTSINAAVPVHNDLAGLQGGIGGEYYHLTQNGYTQITDYTSNKTLTYSGGKLVTLATTGGTSKAITYNGDGTINTVVITYPSGTTKTKTFSWSSGILNSITVT